MKLHLLPVGLVALMALFWPDHMPPKGLLAMVGKANADDGDKARRAPSVPAARDPSVAVQEEYELARKKGTAEAYELFIARHGDDPLAEKARTELKRLPR